MARNLNIVSDQDTETQSAAQTSWSFSATVGYGTASLSASYAKGDAYGNYASVTTTSGLFAGSSGYAVTVGGTTTLTAGGAGEFGRCLEEQPRHRRARHAEPHQLDELEGVVLGLQLLGFQQPASAASSRGSARSRAAVRRGIAQATIAPGTVNILNAALQKSLTGKTPDQVIAALNRSATAQNKAANTLPGGLLQTLQNQADRSNALIGGVHVHGQSWWAMSRA